MPHRLLLVTWDGGGVVPPELGLAHRLVERGHDVHVLGDPPMEAEAKEAGCSFTPWTTAPHVESRRPEDAIVKDWEVRNPLRFMSKYLSEFLADPAPRWAADVDAVLADGDFDAGLVDFALPATQIPFEARGIPTVGMMPNIWVLPTKGIPPMGPGTKPATNPLTQARDAVIRGIVTHLFDRALPAINATRKQFGLVPKHHTQEQMLAGGMLVLSSPVFDFTSPHLPANVAYAGPVLDDPSWSGSWTSPWSDDDERPLVLVGMSSGFQDQVATLHHVADALASLPVRGLITTGLGVEEGAVRSRSAVGDVVVVPHAPHAAILPHAAALVTHCGHGTVMKGLTAGVPLLCMPMGRDQNDTAERVAYWGAGIRLKPTASAASIAAAVSRLLHQPAFRVSSHDLGRHILAGEGCIDPVAHIESVAAGTTPPTRAAA